MKNSLKSILICPHLIFSQLYRIFAVFHRKLDKQINFYLLKFKLII